MQLPFFYEEEISPDIDFHVSEASSRHIVQVLRKKAGDHVQFTNGRGLSVTAEILEANKKKTRVHSLNRQYMPPTEHHLTIAISFIKNAGRFEWFLEKATEIGIQKIQPLICSRTEKVRYKKERMSSIAISAMLQSQQVWLPEISAPVLFCDWLDSSNEYRSGFIAHCLDSEKAPLQQALANAPFPRTIMIGPEGDFTTEEIAAAIQAGFTPVSLGETRLRTETAAIVAAVMLTNIY